MESESDMLDLLGHLVDRSLVVVDPQGSANEARYRLLEILRSDPFQSPPPFEKLVGDLAGAFSRRINIQHRLVYQVLRRERVVKVIRMWTHYE